MSLDWCQDVLEFHKKVGSRIGKKPSVPSEAEKGLRKTLVLEEMGEFLEALDGNNLVDLADAVGDCIYVLIGTAISYGIDLMSVWEAIHRANMEKPIGKLRGDGKIIKPENWPHPNIKSVLFGQKEETIN